MTLHTRFPEINNIADVLPHLTGRPEFIVVNKEYATFVNYAFQGAETFPSITDDDYLTPAILRECRGLIFDAESGDILSRPLSKFFNMSERSDTSVIDVSRPHQVLEKLDGSMARPLLLDGGIRWATKMGLTTVGMQAETFAAAHPEYDLFARHIMSWDATPIFEWCSPKNRIVVPYDQDALILLAVRHNRSGEYWPYESIVKTAEAWNIPCVKAVCPPLTSPTAFREFEETVRAWEGAEGVVITWDDGSRCKIKAQKYVSLHRAKSLTENERDVVGLILDEKTDDLLPLLPDPDKANLLRYQTEVWVDIGNFIFEVERVRFETQSLSRKDFAMLEGVPTTVRAAIFAIWDNPHFEPTAVRDWAIGFIRKNLGNRGAFDGKARNILKTAKWTR